MKEKFSKNIIIAIVISIVVLMALAVIVFYLVNRKQPTPPNIFPNEVETPRDAIPKKNLPLQKILESDYHIFQSFNNCAPAALSMALTYYGITVSQEKLALELRPNNNAKGFNDDKSTPPEELAEYVKKYDLLPFYRANGDIELLKQFIAADIPIVMRTLLKKDEDFAHYRVVKGYDENSKEIIQDDSLQGKNKRYSYEEFLNIWKEFNYAYLVFVEPQNKKVVEEIIGKAVDSKVAWKNAINRAENSLKKNQNDVMERYNLSVAYYYIGENKKSVEEFEKIEKVIPQHKIWYQIEPIYAYFNLGNYERVFELSDLILNNHNKGFPELYKLKGDSYLKLGKPDLAKIEFEKMEYYSKKVYVPPAVSPSSDPAFRGE